jgi:dephospho-CoA kinase
MRNIVIVGRMASGKTTVAKWLRDSFGYEIMSLAGPIKEMEVVLDDLDTYTILRKHITPYYTLTPEQFEIAAQILREAKEIPRETPKPRKRLQFIGTDGFRQRIDENFWIALADKKAQTGGPWVIDDVRFHNEYEYFVIHGWYNIGLYVDLETQKERIQRLYGVFDPTILTHASELDIEDIINSLHSPGAIRTNRPAEETLAEVKQRLEADHVLKMDA